MKCPKCHYLSFDPEPRCRNCGYSLALEDSDLMMVGPDASGESPVDLTLRDRVDSPQGEPMRVPDGGGAATVVEPVAAAPSAGAPARAVPAAASGPQQAPRATPRGPFDPPLAADPPPSDEPAVVELAATADAPSATDDSSPAETPFAFEEPAPQAPGAEPVEAGTLEPVGEPDAAVAAPAAPPAPAPEPVSEDAPTPTAPAPVPEPAVADPGPQPLATDPEPPAAEPVATPAVAAFAPERPDSKPVTPSRPGRSRQAAPVTTELPLFVQSMDPPAAAEEIAARPDAGARVPEPDASVEPPLVTMPDVPVPPLAMRRGAADAAARGRKLGPLDHDLLEDLRRFEKRERREAGASARAAARAALPTDLAGAGKRLGAAAVDASILGGLSVAVLWMTLRWCDLGVTEIGVLPAAPTVAFLLLVGLGYLLMFTAAGGQTVGKMVTGIRVVGDGPADGGGGLSIRQAMVRELLALPSTLALGAGLLPAFFGQQRALHDRMAHTRVVRA